MIRLMLVDDHDVVRTGLRAFLETQAGIEVVAEAAGGAEAIPLALERRPDVVVMDITMPQMDGMEATRRLLAEWPECRVLALTVHADQQYFFEMLSAGALGYVTKSAAAEELVAAVRAVARGDVYLQPALARWLLEDYQRLSLQAAEPALLSREGSREGDVIPEKRAGLEVLSEREQQVLGLLADGFTNPEIGARLGLSPKTIARHRERIMHKLNLHSCTELVKFAIRTGLIQVL